MRSQKTKNQRRSEIRALDGLLVFDKSVGPTSNATLQRVKRLFRARKAGHTGSLDPLASGMLPMCFGQATKISGYLLDADKTYRVVARFGKKTDTGDAQGTMVAESKVTTIEREALEQALDSLIGDIEQVPPMYSALKKDGKRFYELARQGIEVDRPARSITIRSLKIETFDSTTPVILVECSKGTYVRTLIEDLAELLGTYGHVVELRRLGVVPFTEAQMVTMEQVEKAAKEGDEAINALLVPADSALVGFPAVKLDQEQSIRVRQGCQVQVAQPPPEAGFCRIYDEQGGFVGIGEASKDGRIAPKRLFVAPDEIDG